MSVEPIPPGPALLEVRGLRKCFASSRFGGRAHRIVAAEDVSFRVRRGEAVALVGESGSGKSTLARLVLRLETEDGGRILLEGVDVLAREPRRASLGYRRRVQMIFQDPFGSLNPVHTVHHHLERPLLRHGRIPARSPRAAVRRAVLDLLRTVGLAPAEEFVDRRPYELSGGQRQRVAIARALAAEPDLLVADEPTSMLDVSVRMGILNLLAQLKRERGLAILLITHDLASARYLAERVLVLYRGRVVEDGPSAALVESPAHPYTRALLASIADADGARPRPRIAARAGEGEPAGGCPFAPRCAEAVALCRTEDPAPRETAGRVVRCHLRPGPAGAR